MVHEGFRSFGRKVKDLSLTLLALVLRPFRVPTLHRWLSILALSVVGLVVGRLLTVGLAATARRLGDLAAGLPMPVFALGLVVLASILYAPLVRLGAMRWGHWRSVLVYPPIWMAAILGAMGTLSLKRVYRGLPLPDVDLPDIRWSIGIWLASPLLCLVMWAIFSVKVPTRRRREGARHDRESSVEQALKGMADDPEGRLIPWLEMERPVSDPYRDDLFRMRFTARRIAAHFFERRLGTVGLTGPYGTGKSSVIRFVEYYLEEDRGFRAEMVESWRARLSPWGGLRRFPPRVIVCKVSAWGMVDRPAPAAVLRQAVERLAKEADCLSVITLPDRYVQAFKGAGSTWLNLPLMLSSADDATEQLRRLQPILDALDARLIVIIEDIDRNADGLEGAVDGQVARDLQAMLAHLREVDRVSFMLAVSTPGVIDFSRLCERIERIRPLEARLIWSVVSALRTYCLDVARKRGDLQTAHDDSLREFEPRQELQWAFLAGLSTPPVTLSLCELMGNPRALKQALRHTWQAWQQLHGEVDLDDLLICNVIRARSPDAFDFLIESYETLRSERIEDDRRRETVEAWSNRVRDCGQRERDPLWSLVAYLFPRIENRPVGRSSSAPQGVQGSIYWDRIVSGYVSEPIRDQEILRGVALWKQGDDDPAMANALAGNPEYSATFERILEGRPRDDVRLTRDELCRLASRVFAIALEAHEADAKESTIPGFIVIWRRITRLQRTDGYADWLQEEVNTALPRSLALANDLEYYWGSASQGSQLLTLEEAIRIRENMVGWARQNFTGEQLARSLGRTEVYALFHFVRHQHIDYGPAFDARQWRWLIPHLVEGMEIASGVVTPQVCILLSRSSQHFTRDGEGRRERVVSRELDNDFIEALIPDIGLRHRIFELIAQSRQFVGGPDPSIAEAVNAIGCEAQQRLQEPDAGILGAAVPPPPRAVPDEGRREAGSGGDAAGSEDPGTGAPGDSAPDATG